MKNMLFDHLRRDLRFAVRQLAKNPAFTITAILVLGLGIAASLAIFAFVDAALLKPLPYRDPARLAGVYERIPLCPQCNLSYFDYLDWKRMNKTLASLDIYQPTGMQVASPEGAIEVRGIRVSAGFFRTLGVAPILGRDFVDGEDQPSAARVVVLSYSSWQNRYGARRDAVGQSINLDGDAYQIVGVLPRDFHFAPAQRAEFWAAIHATNPCEQRRSCHNLYGVGRLRDGVSFATAAADFKQIAAQLETQYPDSNRGQGSNIVPLSEVIVGRIRPVLIILLSGAALLLLIAAVNVANLLLVRSEGRKREFAVRSSLGASPARLAAQFITEGVLLVFASAMAGIFAANTLCAFLLRLIPEKILNGMPYLAAIGFHWREGVFAAAISLAAAILFTLTPALRLVRSGLADSSRGYSGVAWRRLGSQMVMLELATAIVLLVGASLLAQSLYRVLNVNLGMRPDHLATLIVGAPRSVYATNERVINLHREILRRVSEIPGVVATASSSVLPVSGGNTSWMRFADRPFTGDHNEVQEREVTPDYFTTLGARLASGRYFSETEDASKPRVVIVDRSFVQKFYPSKDPIGQQMYYQSRQGPPLTIVGVVDDIKEGALDSTTWPTMYVPYNQDPDPYFVLVVRSAGDEHALLPALISAIHRFDPTLMTGDAHSMDDQINDSAAAYLRRASATLAVGFAGLALILAVVGLYGVIAYSVSQRTREIGVRIALGAERGRVYRLILSEAARLIAGGVVIGVAAAFGGAMLLGSLLFGVRSWDVPTFAGVAALLTVCALAASFLPARRAASVNPVEALRAE